MNLESGNIDTQAGLKGFKKLKILININLSQKSFLDIEQ